ncbi:MAG TPA: hypothetical protein VG326_08515 [Tepidisphaeraceae bacterium]|jgi:hypothetical protein|nr:hypothetical protein [Tepidisphaeraceae bacterium]
MTTAASTLLAPASSAYPKYAGVFSALAAVIAADGSAPVSGAPPTPPPAQNPASQTIHAGQFVMLDGGESIGAFDFGNPSARFNSLRGFPFFSSSSASIPADHRESGKLMKRGLRFLCHSPVSFFFSDRRI